MCHFGVFNQSRSPLEVLLWISSMLDLGLVAKAAMPSSGWAPRRPWSLVKARRG